MAEQEHSPSRVVPLLVAVLVCDVAVADRVTGKKNLIGIFDRLHVSEFPTRRPVSLYFKLVDAEGYYRIEVRYEQTATGKELARAEGELTSSNRLVSADLYIDFPPLPFPTEGTYEFQIWANEMFLGSTSIVARQRV